MIAVTSVEKPNSPYAFTLPEETVKRLWSDFQAYRATSDKESASTAH